MHRNVVTDTIREEIEILSRETKNSYGPQPSKNTLGF